MFLVDFDGENRFWSIMARKTGVLLNKMVFVDFGRK